MVLGDPHDALRMVELPASVLELTVIILNHVPPGLPDLFVGGLRPR